MRVFYSVLVLIVFTFNSQAQNSVSGNITDATDGLPLPSASIIIKGTTTGVVSDFDGNYTINNVPNGSILQISYIGYKTFETAPINSSQTLNVALEAETSQLDEVVIIGYGTQSKKEITGAVAVVSSESIEAVKPTRIEQALQGQVAGVNITSQSGAPGAGADIRIRGITTNGNNAPLILVDGNRITELSVINPGDIESITVLKDATAGIYGVLAANGVILITTKSGRKNQDLKFEYDAYVGFQETTRKIPLLNAKEYALLRNEAQAAAGQPLAFTDVSALGEGTNWQDEVFQTAPIINHNLSMRGGSEKSSYTFGASALTQDGIVGGNKSGFVRYTTLLGFNTELLEGLNFRSNLRYTGTKRKTLPETGLGSVLFNALNFAPTDSPRDEFGNFTSSINYPIEVVNPLAQIDNTFNRTKVDRLSGVFGMDYSFLNGFKATVNYQWNYTEVRPKVYSPAVQYGNNSVFDNLDNDVIEIEQFYRDYTFDAFIDYDKTFNDIHDLKVTLGTSVYRTFADEFGLVGNNIPASTLAEASVHDSDNIEDIYINRSNRTFDSRLLSYFARLQYDYDDKYLFSVVIRRDGSTNFGPENKFGYFPSGSIGWVASKEKFLEESNSINFLKFRASYGIIGNDKINSFAFVSLLNGESTYVFDGNSIVFGTATGPIANPEVRWEENETFDIGLDATLFNDFDITFDYFRKTTKDLLLQPGVSGILGPTAPGAAAPFVNAGSVLNKGFEFQIKYQKEWDNQFGVNVSYNFTTLDNEVLTVDNGLGFIEDGSFGIGQDPPARMQVGQPMGVFYGYQTNGVFQNADEVAAHPSQIALGAHAQPGDLRYVDLNQDGVVDSNDRTFIGNPIPNVTMGLNLGFDYKNWDFQSYFFASLGNDIVRNYNRNQTITNRAVYDLNRWTGEGSTNEHPRVTAGANTNTVFSNYYVEDGSFLRAQNMQIGYSISNETLEKLGLDKLRFYASVNNAFTLTKYRGFDPAASDGQPVGGGIDYGFYPNPRIYTLGVNLKF